MINKISQLLADESLGGNKPMLLNINGVTYKSSLDIIDGNKESLPCSNRKIKLIITFFFFLIYFNTKI
jgi:hypothetical protein